MHAREMSQHVGTTSHTFYPHPPPLFSFLSLSPYPFPQRSYTSNFCADIGPRHWYAALHIHPCARERERGRRRMSAGRRPWRQLTSLCLLHLSPKGETPDTMGSCSSLETRGVPQDQPQAGIAPSPQESKGTKAQQKVSLSFFLASLSLCFLFCPPGPLLRRGRASVHKETCDTSCVSWLCVLAVVLPLSLLTSLPRL